MNVQKTVLFLIAIASVLVLVIPLSAQAADQNANVIYQTSFTTDPHWVTDNPSNDYWDPSLQMYHFGIEPSTGAYAYAPIYNFDSGSFTLEYDVILNQIDEGATFRFGLTGNDMNLGNGPDVLSEFTNAKYGRIMWLHVVTPSAKLLEINSQSGAVEMGPTAYKGPTATYALNKTYHVTITYDSVQNTLSMRVNEKLSGTQVWGYFLNTVDNLKGFTRIYLGSVGDYGNMNIYATGYLSNVRLTTPAAATATPVESSTVASTPTTPPPFTTPKHTIVIPTPYPTETQKSPLSAILAIGALAIAGVFCVLKRIKEN